MEDNIYEIWITTYEISKKGSNPVLSHVFYGKTLEQAYGYAKSHLITDFFFSSSFIGSMKWNNTVLQLSDVGKIINVKENEDIIDAKKTLDNLVLKAREVNEDQKKKGIAMLIREVSNDNKK
jgi:hypothetical protein